MGDVPTFDQAFAPFASELDWKIASWAVQEGIGQKTLDRLFSIPRVGLVSSSVLFSTIIPTWICLLCRWWSASVYLIITLESFIRSLMTSLCMLNGKPDLYGSGRILMQNSIFITETPWMPYDLCLEIPRTQSILYTSPRRSL